MPLDTVSPMERAQIEALRDAGVFERPWFVQFTPVGWQVRSRATGDESSHFGTGQDEYKRAKEHAAELNATT